VTFTQPEVARVGLTEADAAHRGGQVAWPPMTEMDRALAAEATDGFIRLLAGPRPIVRGLGGGRVVGATIVAERAGEMIHEPALAIATGMFTGRLAATTHADPTWSYGVQLAAAQFFTTIAGRHARPAERAENGVPAHAKSGRRSVCPLTEPARPPGLASPQQVTSLDIATTWRRRI
jgi:Pyridine nucleotide-disulphide oxidoreductase, dimerisation domain